MEDERPRGPQTERDPFPKMIIIVAIISVTLFTFVAAMLFTDLANRNEERFTPPVGDDAFDIPDVPVKQRPAAGNGEEAEPSPAVPAPGA